MKILNSKAEMTAATIAWQGEGKRFVLFQQWEAFTKVILR